MSSCENEKELAAQAAAALVEDGMFVGLGSGSTSILTVQALACRVRTEALRIEAVSSSIETETVAREGGIPIRSFASDCYFDLYLDGADQVDASGRMIKGGGGALFREKMLALRSRRIVVVVDSRKPVVSLGLGFPLPVDVVPFGAEITATRIAGELGCDVKLREQSNGALFRTNDGNHVADCHFENGIADPERAEAILRKITGVVETGLFLGLCDELIIGRGATIERRSFERKGSRRG